MNQKIPLSNRLFIGVYPCGIVYADRQREEHGDYVRLAFLSYSTLELEIKANCPKELRTIIEKYAATIQHQRGEQFLVSSSGQTVTLGG